MSMLNFNPELDAGEGLKRNLRALERHGMDDHYLREFQPGDFLLLNSAATVIVPAATPRWPAIDMPDAAFSDAFISFRKPSEWRSGKLRLWFWYTSDVASTNNFRINIFVRAIRTGEVLPGTILVTSAATYAGPAVASTDLRSPDVYTTTSFDSDDEKFAVTIERNGGHATDNNVNHFQLLLLVVEHIPAVLEST